MPTIRLASQIGIKNVLVMARRFGLSGQMEPYLPLAIGACEATPLEMATAFTVFPNLGIQPKPYFIRKIEDYDHVKKEQAEPKTHKVLDPDIAEQMLGLLQDVVQNGTARAAKSLNRPLGGKTGTTNDFTDAWFVGFSPSITTAVWVGFDSKKTLGDKEAGAVVALPIWMQFMQEILKDKPVEQFSNVEILTDHAREPALKAARMAQEAVRLGPSGIRSRRQKVGIRTQISGRDQDLRFRREKNLSARMARGRKRSHPSGACDFCALRSDLAGLKLPKQTDGTKLCRPEGQRFVPFAAADQDLSSAAWSPFVPFVAALAFIV